MELFKCLVCITKSNNLYISELVDSTTGLMGQVLSLLQDLSGLDQRVSDPEAGGGGSANITGIKYTFDSARVNNFADQLQI